MPRLCEAPLATVAGDEKVPVGSALAIVAVAVAVWVSPSGSDTTRVIVYVPLSAYVLAGEAPVPVVPSPNVHA
jgi:hypothetical protein